MRQLRPQTHLGTWALFPVTFHLLDSDTCPALASTSCPRHGQAPPTLQQNVAKGPRDTCQLAVASGSKEVPYWQTAHPGRTLFPSPVAGPTFPKIPCPEKGCSPPKGAGRAMWTSAPYPPRGPVSTPTSPVPARASNSTSPSGVNRKTK